MTAPIRHVSDTALWVAMYRAFESERPDAIFRDPFARRLAGERGAEIVEKMPRARAMAWPMIVRTAIMDEIVLRCVSQGATTVVNLAAGLDTRAWRLALPATLRWFDVDLPDMIAYRQEHLADAVPVCAHEDVAADVADSAALGGVIARACGGPGPALVVTEGLLVYLTDAQVRTIATRLHEPAGVRWWLLDLATPLLLQMLKRNWQPSLQAANTPMQFAPAEGTAFFAPMGWREAEFRSVWPEAMRLKRTMPMAWLWNALGKLRSKATREAYDRMSAIVLLERAPMTLTAGTRLGVYEIVGPLGAGGMGEVYRGRDTRLDRAVAIKVLRADLIADTDARRRFEREARAASALNHPGVVSVFDLGTDGEIDYLVMEYIEGRTLDQVLADGVPPVARALDWAVAIADAIAAAHAAGLIHRDLKPGNVMTAADGRIKVLDFGLAKLGASALGAMHDLTTLSASLPGVLLGTAAYMAPEQIDGRTVDARSDVFALGALLYELLSGRRAFAGASPVETLHAALTRDPVPLASLVPSLPADVDRIVGRCLRKDPQRRFQTMADLKVTLEDAREALAASTARGAPARTSPPALRARTVAIAAAAFVSGGLLAAALWPKSPAAGLTSDVVTRPFVRLTADAGLSTEPSISADGRLIAFASDRAGDSGLDIWVQQTSGGPPIRLTADPTDDHQPDVSPDGGLVAFRSERDGGGVYVVPALGGEPRLLASGGRAPRFSPDGRLVAFWTGGWLAARAANVARQLYVVPVAGGEARRIADGLFNAGDEILGARRAGSSAVRPTGGGGRRRRRGGLVVGAAGRPPRRRGRARSRSCATPAWCWPPETAPTCRRHRRGAPAACCSRPAAATPVSSGPSASTRRPAAAIDGPRPITAGPGFNDSPAVSSDGRLVFAGLDERPDPHRSPPRRERGTSDGPAARPEKRHRADRTGQRVDRRPGDRVPAVPVRQQRAVDPGPRRPGRERQLVSTPPGDLNPVISRDGRWVAYSLGQAGYVIGAEGGAPRQVCDDCVPFGWLGDDDGLIVLSGRPAHVELLEVGTGRRSAVVVSTVDVVRPTLAPGERWIAFNTRDRIWVAAFDPGHPPAEREWGAVAPVVQPGDRPCGWSPDGTLLYLLLVRDGFRCLYAVRIDTATGRPRGEVFPVYHFHDARMAWGSTGFGSAVVQGLFLADQVEYTGNIWSTSLKPLP